MEIKYLLLALPLLLVGCDSPLKLHYNDCVKVTEEFYGPTYGVVTKYNGFNSYTVFRKIDNKTSEWMISADNLTKVDTDYCRDIPR